MTKREFATLLFRLLGLYFVGVSLSWLSLPIEHWLDQQNINFNFANPPTIFTLFLSGAPFLLLSGFGFVLFAISPGLAANTIKDDSLQIHADLASLRAAAFISIGALTVSNALPALIGALYIYRLQDDLITRQWSIEESLPFAQLVKLAFGIFLLYSGGVRILPLSQWGRDLEDVSSDAES